MIKFNIYILLLVISTWAFQSCDKNDDDNISVPIELQKAFSTMYPDVIHVSWEAEGQYYVADFRDKSSYEASAWYTASGQWEMTEIDIPYSSLPENIKVAFKESEYSKVPWKVDDVDKLERKNMGTIYVIEVESDKEVDLYYSEDGALVKTVVDVEDNGSSDYLPSIALSTAMKNFIETKYVGARVMEVDIEDDRNIPEFGFIEVDIIHQRIHKEVLFDKNEWYSTSWEVSSTLLPTEVINAINSQYSNYRIDDVNLYEKPNDVTYYQVELETNGLPDRLVKYLPDGEVYQ